jgi:flagellar motor protein MotB
MKCPVCPFENIPADAEVCSNCGTDLTPIRRISEISVRSYNQALEFVKSGETDTAMIKARNAVDLNERFVEARILLGKILWKKNQYKEALLQWETVAKIDHNNQPIKDLINTAKQQIKKIRKKQILFKTMRISGLVIIIMLLFFSYNIINKRLGDVKKDLLSNISKANSFKAQLLTYRQNYQYSDTEVAKLKEKVSKYEDQVKRVNKNREGISNLLMRLGNIEGVFLHQKENIGILCFSDGLFPSGKDILDRDAKNLFKKIIDTFKSQKLPPKIIIEGHTDDIPIKTKGSRWSNNWTLGLSRSNSVLINLKHNLGLTDNKIMICSAGESNPPFVNNSKENRERNRTVVLYFTYDD